MFSSPDSPAPDPGSICIRAPNWVGDVVMATPTFRCVRDQFPTAFITVVVPDSVADVLRETPWFDRGVRYHRTSRWGAQAVSEFLRCALDLRENRPDLGIILPNSFSSALMMRLSGAGRRVGYLRDLRGWLLTGSLHRPRWPDGTFRPTYMADYYLSLCEAVGLSPVSRRTQLPYSGYDLQTVRGILCRQGLDPVAPLFLFHATAGYGPSKLWPLRHFADLADMLEKEFGAQICGIGAPGASQTMKRIQSLAGARLHDLTQCGIDLHLLKALVALSNLMVTTDSGPRHYGVALGVPTVCIMGPTDPDYSTSDRPNDRVVRVDVECGPCQEKFCARDHRCMEQITPDMVLDACRGALEERRS